jgi:hypothetical protein
MRRALICVFCLMTTAAIAPAGPHPSSSLSDTPNLSVVLDFAGPFSNQTVIEMKQETNEILRETGLHLEWVPLGEAVEKSHPDLVLVRFRGACMLDPAGLKGESTDPSGPLAFTYSTDGVVQPFGDVACDRVAATVRSVLCGSDFSRADFLLGRALGRVLAHELVHMLTGSVAHARDGVTKAALSGKDLIANSLLLSPVDVKTLRRIFSPLALARAGRMSP